MGYDKHFCFNFDCYLYQFNEDNTSTTFKISAAELEPGCLVYFYLDRDIGNGSDTFTFPVHISGASYSYPAYLGA